MKYLLSIFCLLLLIAACKPSQPTEVLVLPSLHGAHEINENYTYGDLMKIAKAFSPDVIGVEIRPIDMEMNSDTLDLYYPIEMIRVRDSFPGKVTGIDFYSEASKNVPVSRKIFTDTTTDLGRLKNLVKAMQMDSLMIKRDADAGIPKIQEEQKRIALTYSAEEFLKGEYDSLTREQYRLEDSIYRNTPYEAYSRFNNNRDLQITNNALELVRKNPSKKVLIIVGANHRNRLVDSLKTKKSTAIKLIQNLSFMTAD